MNKHRKFLFILLIVIFTTMIVSELLLRSFSKDLFVFDWRQHNSIKLFNKHKNDVEVIFMGDSYVFHGIDIEQLNINKVSHNFGLGGEKIYQTYFKLKHYLVNKSLPNLKMVVLNLETRHFIQNDLNLITDYSKFTDNIDFYTSLSYSDRANAYLTNKLYLWRTKSALMGLKLKFNFRENITEYGQGKRAYHLSYNELNFKSNLIIKESVAYKQVKFEFIELYYQKFYELCKSQKIKLVFIQLPNISQVESELLFPEDADKQDINITKYIEGKFPDSTSLNLKNIELGLTYMDFFDSAHLNNSGAKKVSNYIGLKIKPLLEE